MSKPSGQYIPRKRYSSRSLYVQLAHSPYDTRILAGCLGPYKHYLSRGLRLFEVRSVASQHRTNGQIHTGPLIPAAQVQLNELMQVVDRINSR